MCLYCISNVFVCITKGWGLECLRYEIKELAPSSEHVNWSFFTLWLWLQQNEQELSTEIHALHKWFANVILKSSLPCCRWGRRWICNRVRKDRRGRRFLTPRERQRPPCESIPIFFQFFLACVFFFVCVHAGDHLPFCFSILNLMFPYHRAKANADSIEIVAKALGLDENAQTAASLRYKPDVLEPFFFARIFIYFLSFLSSSKCFLSRYEYKCNE